MGKGGSAKLGRAMLNFFGYKDPSFLSMIFVRPPFLMQISLMNFYFSVCIFLMQNSFLAVRMQGSRLQGFYMPC